MPEKQDRNGAQKESSNNSNQISSPAINLPKGGGAIRGIGEKFAANPVTGTGSLSLPIATSPGRSGFGPQLSLSYDSGSGNGPFGIGWSLSLPSITRKTGKGLPKYEDAEESDEFILSGAEDLVPVLIEDAQGKWVREDLPPRMVDCKTYRIQRYRPRTEGLFARIERWANQADHEDTFWRSISKDNITTWYGKTAKSRISDPNDPVRIFSWLICESHDDKGNVIVYEFEEEDSHGVALAQTDERNRSRTANRYLKRIKYGNRIPFFPILAENQPPTPLPTEWLFTLIFDYDERHYEAVELDPNLPEDAQHRLVRASAASPSSSTWAIRPDPFSAYRAGFEVRTYRRCHRVLMFHQFEELGEEPSLVRSTEFEYGDIDYRNRITLKDELSHKGSTRFLSCIQSATQCGYVRDETKPIEDRGRIKYVTYIKKSLPPLEFEYSKATIQEKLETVDAESLENLPQGLDGAQYQWADLDGEGAGGILTDQGGDWYYKRNLSPLPVKDENGRLHIEARFAPAECVSPLPSFSNLAGGQQQILDLAGDGQIDVVTYDGPAPGFFERTEEGGWENFKLFASLPNIAWKYPNLKFVDLTGDGHADIFITEDQAYTWYPSLAEAGFGPAQKVRQMLDEEEGPRLVFADGTDSVYLSDISGDGLTDLVRIRNGEVSYWPNLGYGRFGAKVTMDNAPWFDSPDQFDQKRIRLADIDGTGVTDILYLKHDSVCIYFNKSGNTWSDVYHLKQLPAIDNTTSVMTADLLGNGTACLVWSSPLPGNARSPMRYLDLMGGQKPHLLIRSVNNLGAETCVHYAPSTKFYLKDKEEGKPWITRLHFPVHVVERVETYDHISHNKFVTRYAYHHGYFDGEDREFRGFGMVEQWDTEEYAALAGNDSLALGGEGWGEGATNIDAASHLPPVHTKTWFHTGFYKDREHISTQYKDEYYNEDPDAKLLRDTILPDRLSAQEEHEACRALKSRLLRREIYALDESEKSRHPYQVTESNYGIVKLQPVKDVPHAVFFAHENETLEYHYERNPDDPRMSHSMVLEVDEKYGHLKKAAAIAYPRRPKEGGPEHEPEQRQTIITYTESEFIDLEDELDSYRTGIPYEVKSYEITGLNTQGTNPFKIDEILEIKHFDEIQYNELPTEGLEQKRLIERSSTLFYKNDLSGPLELGEAESMALPHKTYQLAFTPGIMDDAFLQDPQDPDDPPIRITDALLRDEARYVKESDLIERGLFPAGSGEDNWWIPSGRAYFSPDPENPDVEFAREHFYLPHKFEDPFGNRSEVAYDTYDLLIRETKDALNNIVKAENDYRTMQPYRVTGPNGNRSQVAFDTLGMVVGTAVMGKEDETRGDTLEEEEFNPDLADQAIKEHIDDPFFEPHAILQRATTRMVYDVWRFHRSREANPDDEERWQPVVVYALTRETHAADLNGSEQTDIRHSFLYSDGLGREVQTKIQAEPGDVNGEHTEKRWVGSGWTIYNNKGKPVKQYEPFFSATHEFENNAINGVSSILFYDPLERVVATLHPNHTYEKVVFDPWRQETWDVNDTLSEGPPNADPEAGFYFDLLDEEDYLPTWYDKMMSGTSEEQDAARKSLKHAGTPGIAHLDVQGRTFLTVEQNTVLDDDRNVKEIVEYRTHVKLDIEGNPLLITDARVNSVMAYIYDIAGRQLFQHSMDAGKRRALANVAGNPVRAWDSRKNQVRTLYDELQRPTKIFVENLDEEGSEFLAEHTVYGEDHPDAKNHNLLGQVYKQYDGAGIVTNEEFDFKGNLLRGSRQLVREYEDNVDWSQNPELIVDEIFISSTAYDALNRPISIITPHTENADRNIPPNIIQPVYNEANLLEKVDVWLRQDSIPNGLLDPETADMLAVTNIDYNEKGQRVLIGYGNDTKTEYTYDDETFRLINLKTSSPSGDGDLQNLSYIYDPVGNITEIHDDAQKTIYYKNMEVRPHSRYEYDALYRLIMADGREHIGQHSDKQHDHNDFPTIQKPHPNDPQAMRCYTQKYIYDEVGNILEMIHKLGDTPGGETAWKRRYQYALGSNRLMSTCLPKDDDAPDYSDTPEYSMRYEYDPHGNMIKMPHLQPMDWDFKNQLHAVQKQVVNNGGTPEITYYVYDAAGQRVRKVTERQAGPGETPMRMEERIYLGGFEVYRKYSGSGIKLERETLHIMDDQKRIALVETKTIDESVLVPDPTPLIRYQIDNHLGSSSLELDESGNVISYEEYYPYGSTSYQAVKGDIKISLKRYQFTGQERDEESGFNYHAARYYAPWICRWTSCDPKGAELFSNFYSYVGNNPINFSDTSGNEPDPVKGEIGHVAPMNKQGKSVYDTFGNRMVENEHIMPKSSIKSVMDDDYTDWYYKNDTTVRNEVDSALNKTHAKRGGANADNARSARLKHKAATGLPINVNEELFEASVHNAIRARNATHSVVSNKSIIRGAFSQLQNMFANQRLFETAQKIGATPEDVDKAISSMDEDRAIAPAKPKPKATPKLRHKIFAGVKAFGRGAGIVGGVAGLGQDTPAGTNSMPDHIMVDPHWEEGMGKEGDYIINSLLFKLGIIDKYPRKPEHLLGLNEKYGVMKIRGKEYEVLFFNINQPPIDWDKMNDPCKYTVCLKQGR